MIEGNIETTDYLAGKHYTNGTLAFFQHSEGRVRNNSGAFSYEYNLTDHLGNVRVTVDEGGAVIQKDDYYPFGLTFNSYTSTVPENQYKYNGKEEQQEWGVIDYGARMYQADLGRFFTQDRFAEKYLELSQYHYVAGNPIKFIDVNGDSIVVNGVTYRMGGEYSGDDQFVANVFTALNYILDNDADETGVISFMANSEEHCLDIVENTKENNPLYNNPRRQSYFAHGYELTSKNKVSDTKLIWDSSKGIKFDESSNILGEWLWGEAGKRSPAEVLLHELAHAKSFFEDKEKHFEDQLTYTAYYGNVEEADVTRKVENVAAERLGRTKKRKNIKDGVFFETTSTISTDEKNK